MTKRYTAIQGLSFKFDSRTFLFEYLNGHYCGPKENKMQSEDAVCLCKKLY